MSLVIILSYYLMLSAAETLAQQGRVPIIVALWTPNVVLASIGVVLFIRQAHELTRGGQSFVGRFAATTRSRVAMALRRAS